MVLTSEVQLGQLAVQVETFEGLLEDAVFLGFADPETRISGGMLWRESPSVGEPGRLAIHSDELLLVEGGLAHLDLAISRLVIEIFHHKIRSLLA